MRFLAACLVTIGLASADTKPARPTAPKNPPAPAPAPAAPAAPAEDETKVPEADAIFSAQIKTLPEPEAEPIPKGIVMAITASDEKAQEHVIQGLNALQGGWDFEAYRHFCAALKVDPDCLMAHWGVALALIEAEPGLREQSTAAVKRMKALLEKNVGTELEQSYARAMITYIRSGPEKAAAVFSEASVKFPNDPQLKLMSALFSRDGYDATGSAKIAQAKAEDALKSVADANSDNPIYLYAYLMIRAESPHPDEDLPRARKLCQLAPAYGPFQHMLGYFEWRCGNHSRAVEAFSKASQAYSTWMKATSLTPVDCPGWVNAECFRAVALASKGDYPTALAVAKAAAAIPVPADVIENGKVMKSSTSDGARQLLWEARTLPVRLLIRRNAAGDVKAAIEALPPRDSQKSYARTSLCTWYYEGLAFYLETRKAIDASDLSQAAKVADAFSLNGQNMQEKTRGSAAISGELTFWYRAIEALNSLSGEVHGLMAMADAGGHVGTAESWYSTALQHQKQTSRLMPPALLLPMQARLSEVAMAEKNYEQAIKALLEGDKAFPNDVEVLTRLAAAYKAAGKADEAAATTQRLKAVKSE